MAYRDDERREGVGKEGGKAGRREARKKRKQMDRGDNVERMCKEKSKK